MASVEEVTLVLVALANPVRRKVAYRAAIWQVGNGPQARRDTSYWPRDGCEAGDTTAAR